MPSYELVVKVVRDLPSDTEIARINFPDLPAPEALVQQLRLELQQGWDEAGIAGHFDVVPGSYRVIP